MTYFRSFNNSMTSRITCEDVELEYHIDWLMVGLSYGEPSMCWSMSK